MAGILRPSGREASQAKIFCGGSCSVSEDDDDEAAPGPGCCAEARPVPPATNAAATMQNMMNRRKVIRISVQNGVSALLRGKVINNFAKKDRKSVM